MPNRGATVEVRFERIAFFPGEQLRARVFVSFDPQSVRRSSSGQLNVATSPADTAHSLSQLVVPDDEEGSFDLEWLAVQLHGQAAVNPALVSLPANPEPPKSEMSVDADGRIRPPNFAQADETGRCIFVTRPAVLLQNVQIPSGSKRELSYTATLPASLPPSYRGTAVRYSYFLAVGVQERGQPHRVLKVPFRVLVNAGASCLLSLFPGYPDLEDCSVKVKEMLSRRQALESARIEGPGTRGPAALPPTGAELAAGSVEGAGASEGLDAASLAKLRHLRRMESADRDEHGSPRYEVPLNPARPGGSGAGEEEEEEEEGGAGEGGQGEEPFSVDPDFAVLSGGGPAGFAGFGALDSSDWDSAVADTAPGPPSFNIRRGEEPMVRFALGREAFRVGDSVAGILDFSAGVAPCTAVRVALESEEAVAPGLLAPAAKGRPAPPAASTRTYGEAQELTVAALLTNFSFFVPHDAPASFTSDIVSLKWSLALEFVVPTGKGGKRAAGPADAHAWPAASEGPSELLHWRTPVALLNARIPTSGGQALALSLAL